MASSFFVRAFWVLVCVGGIACAPALAREPRDKKAETPEELYKRGERYLKQGYYTKALESFNDVRVKFRDDPMALEAELAIADLHYEKAEYEAARLAYEAFLRAHPRYKRTDYIVYRMGMCSVKQASRVAARDQTATRSAVAVWASFSKRYPESEWRDEVEEELAKGRNRLARQELLIAEFYDQRGAWLSSSNRLERMLRESPASPDRAYALEMLGRAYAESGYPEEAAACLAQLERLAPGSKEARALARHLER